MKLKFYYIRINLRRNYQLKQVDNETRIKKFYPLNMEIKNPLYAK